MNEAREILNVYLRSVGHISSKVDNTLNHENFDHDFIPKIPSRKFYADTKPSMSRVTTSVPLSTCSRSNTDRSDQKQSNNFDNTTFTANSNVSIISSNSQTRVSVPKSSLLNLPMLCNNDTTAAGNNDNITSPVLIFEMPATKNSTR